MLRLLVTLAPLVLAIVLGWIAARTESDGTYLDALRVLYMGAIGLALIAALVYVWRKKSGLVRRLLLSALTVAALRVLYVPILDLSLVGAAWVEQIGAAAGLADRNFVAHAALGVLTTFIAGPLCMLLVEGVTRPLRWFTTLALVLLALFAVAAFLSPEDRQLLPQRTGGLQSLDRPPAREPGEGALQARASRLSARLVGFGDAVLRFALPRDGWGGALREAAGEHDDEDPPESLADSWQNIERSFLDARPALRE